MVSGEVSTSASVLPARLHVSSDEEDKEEDEESGHDDDEEDVDDTNHSVLPKDSVHTKSPGRRSEREEIWKYVRRITDHDLSDHVMKTDCTHDIGVIHPELNHGFMEYMRASYPDTLLSEFKVTDTHVHSHGGVGGLDDDEDDEHDEV